MSVFITVTSTIVILAVVLRFEYMDRVDFTEADSLFITSTRFKKLSANVIWQGNCCRASGHITVRTQFQSLSHGGSTKQNRGKCNHQS